MVKLRIKPEKIAGIVALSYLVLIPAGGIFLWDRLRMVQRELEDVAYHMNIDTTRGR